MQKSKPGATRLGIEGAQRLAAAWGKAGSLKEAVELAGFTMTDIRGMHRLRRMTEELLGVELPPHNPKYSPYKRLPRRAQQFSQTKPYDVVVFSDAHFYPGEISDAYRLLLKVLDDIKPRVVLDNGDSLNGGRIGRFDPIGWEHSASTAEELEACQVQHAEIEAAAPKAKRFLNVGNHDIRFERVIAQKLPELDGVAGTTLDDVFPKWNIGWSLEINGTLICKHRWHSGQHANYNNVLRSGANILTGHTHRLQMRPYSDYRGTRHGIEAGTLADPKSEAFHYLEDNCVDWQSGFVVLHLEGNNFWADLVGVEDGEAWLRGRKYKV